MGKEIYIYKPARFQNKLVQQVIFKMMGPQKCFYLGVVLIGHLAVAYVTDYCVLQRKFCGNQRHIACDPDNYFPKNLKMQNFKLLQNTDNQRKTILAAINGYRSQVANGETDLPPAQRMMEISYSSYLPEIAQSLVNRGNIVTNACLSANLYPFPAANQKIFESKTAPEYENDFAELYIHSINSWGQNRTSQEYRNIMLDVSRFVGCAIGYWKEWTQEKVLINKALVTCVFNSAVYPKRPIYVEGAPGSNCEVKGSRPGLCNNIY